MGLYTQEDPIGIAGGLNVYGFGGGDPVNFSDPFGLCPEEIRGTKECDDWNAARAQEAKEYYESQSAQGNPGALGALRLPVRGVNGSEIDNPGNCPGSTVTGCSKQLNGVFTEYVVNVDRFVDGQVVIPAIAATLAHEVGHSELGLTNDQTFDEPLARAISRNFVLNLPREDNVLAQVAGAGPRAGGAFWSRMLKITF